MDKNIREQIDQVFNKIHSKEEYEEVEKVIKEAKGRFILEEPNDFWKGKTPCWELFRCSPEMREECPAYNNPSFPCWEVGGTYCKLFDYGSSGDGTGICKHCRIYKKYGHNEPIVIKLHEQ